MAICKPVRESSQETSPNRTWSGLWPPEFWENKCLLLESSSCDLAIAAKLIRSLYLYSPTILGLYPILPFRHCCHWIYLAPNHFSKLSLWSKSFPSSTSSIQCASSSQQNLLSTYHSQFLPTHFLLPSYFSPSLQIPQHTILLTILPMPWIVSSLAREPLLLMPMSFWNEPWVFETFLAFKNKVSQTCTNVFYFIPGNTDFSKTIWFLLGGNGS